MNAHLNSWLAAGSIVLAFCQMTSLSGDIPLTVPANPTRPSVAAATMESTDSTANIKIYIPGFSNRPAIQVLSSPDRLVVDFNGVDRGTAVSKNDIAKLIHPLILKARLAQFVVEPESITRLVLELAPGVKAVVSPDPHGIIDISLTKGVGKIRASLSESSLPSVPNSTPDPILSATKKESIAAVQSTEPQADVSLTHTNNAIEAETAVTLNKFNNESCVELPQIASPYIGLPSLGSIPIAPVALQGFVSSVDPKIPTIKTAQNYVKSIGNSEPEFRGGRMTLDVQNADLRTILIQVAKVGELNLIMDPEAHGGPWTYWFEDTPWDKILDVVVKNAGLGKEISDGILRVAKMDKLKREAEERKSLEEAKLQSGDLVTLSRKLSYAKVDEVQKIIDTFKSSGRAKIITDPRTNTIIMVDLPRYIEVMQQLLDQLDVKPSQVQIEVKILEANRGWERAFGVSWPQTNSGNANLQLNGQNAEWSAINSPSWNSVNNRPTGDISLSAAFSPGRTGVTSIPTPAGEIWVSFLSNRLSINAIIQALEKENQIKIISEPRLIAFNNSPGVVEDGAKIPYQSMQGGMINGAISVQFTDAMLKLEVTPQITNSGQIILDVEILKEEPSFANQVNGTPIILSKRVKTKVLLDDGGTAVLGGVYTSSTDKGTTGVPFLSKIPLLGTLFRNKTNNEKVTEMLVFISPKIL
jgi:type IV pilus assembly protein PilQ